MKIVTAFNRLRRDLRYVRCGTFRSIRSTLKGMSTAITVPHHQDTLYDSPMTRSSVIDPTGMKQGSNRDALALTTTPCMCACINPLMILTEHSMLWVHKLALSATLTLTSLTTYPQRWRPNPRRPHPILSSSSSLVSVVSTILVTTLIQPSPSLSLLASSHSL